MVLADRRHRSPVGTHVHSPKSEYVVPSRHEVQSSPDQVIKKLDAFQAEALPDTTETVAAAAARWSGCMVEGGGAEAAISRAVQDNHVVAADILIDAAREGAVVNKAD
jgi:hypothetical protein